MHPIPPAYRTAPMVIDWCLRRLERSADPQATFRKMTESGYFDDSALRWIIEEADPILLSRAFRALPIKCFDPVIDRMLARFPD